jgi:hypothetical protein
MTSSTNIPHIYSSFAEFVSASDWNTLMLREYSIELLDTTADSPYNANFEVIHFEIDADSADFEFNLPALSTCTHSDINTFRVRYRITNKNSSAYSVNVNPDGTDLLRGSNTNATLLAGETIDIDSLQEGWQ